MCLNAGGEDYSAMLSKGISQLSTVAGEVQIVGILSTGSEQLFCKQSYIHIDL